MTISPINQNQLDPTIQTSQDAYRNRMDQAFAPVAQLFNETPEQLMNELHSGTSLADLAQSKGISQDDLVAAIKQGLQSSSTSASTLSDSQLTNLANRIANHHHHGHHHGGQSQQVSSNSMSASSASLNITQL
jgi:hypothetical protein